MKSVFARDFCSYFALPCFARARRKRGFSPVHREAFWGGSRISGMVRAIQNVHRLEKFVACSCADLSAKPCVMSGLLVKGSIGTSNIMILSYRNHDNSISVGNS